MVIYLVHQIIYAPTPIKPSYQSLFCLNNRSSRIPNVTNRYYITTPLRPTEGFPWDDLRKISCGCQWMAKVSYGEKQDQKAPIPIALLKSGYGDFFLFVVLK